jgi:GNAT superfamily N-acetyltransferase
MNEELLTVRGKEVRIRLMDEDHIVPGCWGHRDEPNHTSPAFEQWHRELLRRYGNAAAVAICDDRVVGYANFYPGILQPILAAAKACLCPAAVDSQLPSLLKRIEWPADPRDALSIGCVNLAPAFRRAGVGSALVRAAVEWARENGYHTVLAGANDTAWWIPCRPFWEQLGFRVKETIEFEKPREDGELREYTMELVLRS